MKIATWNVNGLRAIVAKGFQSSVDEIAPDVLCLQEIKATEEQLSELSNLEEFPYRWIHPAARLGYSGTAIFSKLPFEKCTIQTPDELINPQEGRVQAIDLGPFFLVNVYTPNVGSELARLEFRSTIWDPEFCSFIDTLSRKKPVIVCGDMNVAHQPIDLSYPERNAGSAGFTDEERLGFSRYISRGWVDVFRYFYPDVTDCYTWWSYRTSARSRNIGWRIDYFLSSPELLQNFQNITIYAQCMGSDHAPVVLDGIFSEI